MQGSCFHKSEPYKHWEFINENGDSLKIVPELCIGCGNCERNCPYGVIHMAAESPKKPGLLSWLLFGSGPGPGENKQWNKDHSNEGARKKAVKCDMCKDLDGGASCVRACPTGAAIRVSPENFFSLSELAGRN